MENVTQFYPELGSKEIDLKEFPNVVEFAMGKMRVKTFQTLQGRGITFERTISAENTTPQAIAKNPQMIGMNVYYMTIAAYDKFKKTNKIAQTILLD